MKAELITSVLDYSDVGEGKLETRLRQEYFLCAASIRDIVERFKFAHRENRPESDDSPSSISLSAEEEQKSVYAGPDDRIDWSKFPSENQIVINDT